MKGPITDNFGAWKRNRCQGWCMSWCIACIEIARMAYLSLFRYVKSRITTIVAGIFPLSTYLCHQWRDLFGNMSFLHSDMQEPFPPYSALLSSYQEVSRLKYITLSKANAWRARETRRVRYMWWLRCNSTISQHRNIIGELSRDLPRKGARPPRWEERRA